MYKFEIINNEFKVIKEIFPISCSVDYDSLSSIKLSMSLDIIDDEFYYNDKNLVVKNDNDEISFTALISTSKVNDYTKRRTLTCYDRTIILKQDCITDSIIIPAHTNIIRYISNNMLDGYDNLFEFIQSNATNKADVYFNVGTSKLEIINYLLRLINYSSILTTKFGYFIAYPYKIPDERDVDISYTDDSNTSIILPEITREFDLFNIPNVFVRVTNNTAINPPIKAIYENNNPDSILSVSERGRKIVDYKEVSNVSDSDTLFAIAKRDCYNSSDVYESLELETAINLEHWYLNIVNLVINSYDINDKYVETSWSIDDLKSSGRMKHNLRRVISV